MTQESQPVHSSLAGSEGCFLPLPAPRHRALCGGFAPIHSDHISQLPVLENFCLESANLSPVALFSANLPQAPRWVRTS